MLQYIATSPVAVPDNLELKKETAEKELERYEKIASLSPQKRLGLSHFSIPQKIQAIGQKYGFELLRLANITRLVREYYFGEVRLENFPAEIEKRVGVNLLTAQEISRYIKQEIIDWDPWAQYLAKLPKMPVREIVAKYPKIAETEITAGYIELRNSDDLSDPTIKNWLQDYISHLGYAKHSQMDRTQYIFHSENAKNLSSQDREKLGIILRSFDENTPLPVDEENGEIVFDGIMEKNPPPTPPFSKGERPIQNFPLSQRGIKGDFEKATSKQESFIKPYAPISQPQRPAPRPAPAYAKASAGKPAPQPILTSPQPPPLHTDGQAYQGEGAHPEIDKYFSTPESPEIPSIRIHSITEHNEPKVIPQAPPRPNISHPISTSPQPSPLHTGGQAYQGEGDRPKYKIIDPFGPRIVEPKLDGNIVDLSGGE